MSVAEQGAYVGNFEDIGAEKWVLAVTRGLNQRRLKVTLILHSNATNTLYILINICELVRSH
jgi:hypothetical protein